MATLGGWGCDRRCHRHVLASARCWEGWRSSRMRSAARTTRGRCARRRVEGSPVDLIHPDTHATFLPGEPGRISRLFLWPLDYGADEVDLVVWSGDRARRRTVSGSLYGIDEILDELVQIGIDAPMTRSARAWAEVARVALRHVAEGRLHPAVADGHDVWTVGQLSPQDRSVQSALADWLPPEAHCVPVDDTRPVRIIAAGVAVAGFERGGGGRDAPHRGGRSGVGSAGLDRLLALRRERPRPLPAGRGRRGRDGRRPPADHAGDRRGRVRGRGPHPLGRRRCGGSIRVRSVVGTRRGVRRRGRGRPAGGAPSGIACLAGAGPPARGAGAGPPGARRRRGDGPVRTRRRQPVRGRHRGAVARRDHQGGHGIRAGRQPPPGSGDGISTFDLASICEVHWHASIDGEPLTDDELAELAASKRPLVKLRGQWVVADPAVLARLARRQQMSGAQALAAALAGTTSLGGEEFGLEATGPLADIMTRLAFAAYPHDRARAARSGGGAPSVPDAAASPGSPT